jgi:hypothetical protein
MERLYSCGANVNYANKSHKRTLDIASDRKHYDGVSLLQRLGAVLTLKPSLNSDNNGADGSTSLPTVSRPASADDMEEKAPEPEREAPKENDVS